MPKHWQVRMSILLMIGDGCAWFPLSTRLADENKFGRLRSVRHLVRCLIYLFNVILKFSASREQLLPIHDRAKATTALISPAILPVRTQSLQERFKLFFYDQHIPTVKWEGQLTSMSVEHLEPVPPRARPRLIRSDIAATVDNPVAKTIARALQ